MSDTEGTEPEDDQPETIRVYVCKKCPGKRFNTDADKDAHREFHRKQRLRNKKPGPLSSKRRSPRGERASSPAPSTAGTLFSVRSAPVHLPTDTSAKARKERAVTTAVKQTKVYKKRYTSG